MAHGKGSNIPFLKVIVPAAVGIIAAVFVSVAVWVAVICVASCILCVALLGDKPYANVYLWFSIALFFFAVADLNRPRSELPNGERIVAVVQIEETPATRGRWQNALANVGYWRMANGDDKQWTKINERIRISIDTCFKEITVGTQLAVRGWINPIDRTGSGYGKLMNTRGIHRQMYLVRGNMISRSPKISVTPRYVSSLLQSAAVERLTRLNIPEKELGVIVAMVAGDKRMIERDYRSDYSTSGSAHLLAVSGLHVGIVFILINILLYFLPLFRRGHLARNFIAIAAIWVYAMVAGMAPSVIRAAFMFSFAQMALATNSYRNGLNIMLGSAIIMLAVNPNYSADPSFMMSYAAVLSIVAFFKPLYYLVRSRFKIVNALTSVVIVGIVATLGTAPLVLYWFGQISVAGILINPVVILTAHIVVMMGVLWLIIPFGFLNPLFSWVLHFAVWLQNTVVRWSASLEWAVLRADLSLWMVAAIYALYIAAAVALYGREEKREEQPFDI